MLHVAIFGLCLVQLVAGQRQRRVAPAASGRVTTSQLQRFRGAGDVIQNLMDADLVQNPSRSRSAPQTQPLVFNEYLVECPAIQYDSAVVEEFPGEYYIYFMPFPESIQMTCLSVHTSLNGNLQETSLLMQRTQAQDGSAVWATPLSYYQQQQINEFPASFLTYSFTYCTLGVRCESDSFVFETPPLTAMREMREDARRVRELNRLQPRLVEGEEAPAGGEEMQTLIDEDKELTKFIMQAVQRLQVESSRTSPSSDTQPLEISNGATRRGARPGPSRRSTSPSLTVTMPGSVIDRTNKFLRHAPDGGHHHGLRNYNLHYHPFFDQSHGSQAMSSHGYSHDGNPTLQPTNSPSPTFSPSPLPTSDPTMYPTPMPTLYPTPFPTVFPTLGFFEPQ